MTLREVERVLAARRLAARARAAAQAASLERMRELLAGVPEPLTDLDHVPATAATVLERVRYLHEHYELERCRVLLLGDHDATSLAFGALGVRAARARVVDVDQRQLRFASDGVDTWFADLRVGLPAPLRDRFDIVLTDPPYSPAGVGLFAARALEAMKREARLLVAYGYPEGSPALGLKVQAELCALELVYEAVLPDFNAYDGALAIGSRARAVRAAADQAQREDRGAARRAARARRSTRAGARRSSPRRPVPDLSAASAPTAGRRCASCSTRPSQAETVVVNLAPAPRLQPLPGGRWRRWRRAC